MKNLNTLLICGLAAILALSSFTFFAPDSENPVKLTVIYGHPDDPAAFEDYYSKVHAPIAAKMKGVARIELTKFEAAPDGVEPSFYRMAELYFPSKEALQKTLESAEGKATVADIANFATGGTTIILGAAEDFALSGQ